MASLVSNAEQLRTIKWWITLLALTTLLFFKSKLKTSFKDTITVNKQMMILYHIAFSQSKYNSQPISYKRHAEH